MEEGPQRGVVIQPRHHDGVHVVAGREQLRLDVTAEEPTTHQERRHFGSSSSTRRSSAPNGPSWLSLTMT